MTKEEYQNLKVGDKVKLARICNNVAWSAEKKLRLNQVDTVRALSKCDVIQLDRAFFTRNNKRSYYYFHYEDVDLVTDKEHVGMEHYDMTLFNNDFAITFKNGVTGESWIPIAKIIEKVLPNVKWNAGEEPTVFIPNNTYKYIEYSYRYQERKTLTCGKYLGALPKSTVRIDSERFMEVFGDKEPKKTVDKKVTPFIEWCVKNGYDPDGEFLYALSTKYTLTVRLTHDDGSPCPCFTTDKGLKEYLSVTKLTQKKNDKIVDAAEETLKVAKTPTRKEEKMEAKSKMSQIATEVVDTNKEHAIIAGKIVAGQTIINRLRKLSDSYIPKEGIVRKVWDSAFGDLVISNLLLLAAKWFPQHEKLNAAAEMTNLAAMVSTKDKLEVQKWIDGILDGIEIPGLGEKETAKDVK